MDRFPGMSAPLPQRTPWISWRQLIEMKVEKIDMLWDPFLPKYGMAGLAGSSDCGKSTLIRWLCIAIALGWEEFLGHPLNAVHRRVYYVATEDTIQGLAAVISRQLKAFPELKTAEGINFLFQRDGVLQELQKKLADQPADLVVLDAWADVFEGNSNSLDDVRANFNDYRDLSQKHGCLVLFIHHLVKNTGSGSPDKNKISGSHAIEAATRSFLELRNGSSYKEKLLTILKGNYTSSKLKEHSLVLDFDEETLSFKNHGAIASFAEQSVLSKRKFIQEEWAPRMKKLRQEEGLSYEKARERLREVYKDDVIPSDGWFKTNAKDDMSPYDG